MEGGVRPSVDRAESRLAGPKTASKAVPGISTVGGSALFTHLGRKGFFRLGGWRGGN